MKKPSKSSTIINAFTGELPVNEPWYKNRLSRCDGCSYNSANSGVDGIKNNLIKAAGSLIGIEEPQCNACGCFIAKKAAMMEEACGLEELGQIPKWPRLKVLVVDENDFNMVNNSPDKININLSKDGSHYIADYGLLKSADNTKVQVLLEGKNMVVSVTASCGCTTPKFTKLGVDLYAIDIEINLNKISLGNFHKNVYINYVMANDIKVGKQVEIRMRGLKTK